MIVYRQKFQIVIKKHIIFVLSYQFKHFLNFNDITFYVNDIRNKISKIKKFVF